MEELGLHWLERIFYLGTGEVSMVCCCGQSFKAKDGDKGHMHWTRAAELFDEHSYQENMKIYLASQDGIKQ